LTPSAKAISAAHTTDICSSVYTYADAVPTSILIPEKFEVTFGGTIWAVPTSAVWNLVLGVAAETTSISQTTVVPKPRVRFGRRN